jgi:hypothetical protein
MIDALKFDKWRAEFCLCYAACAYDLTLAFDGDLRFFVSPMTTSIWLAYKEGRIAERQAGRVVLPVRTQTNWHDVNTAAAGG